MSARILVVFAVIVIAVLGILYAAGRGFGVEPPRGGEPQARAIAPEVVAGEPLVHLCPPQGRIPSHASRAASSRPPPFAPHRGRPTTPDALT